MAYGINLDKHLLIRFPLAMYYFVIKDDVAPAEDIGRGLELMLASGEFVQRFDYYLGDLIEQLGLESSPQSIRKIRIYLNKHRYADASSGGRICVQARMKKYNAINEKTRASSGFLNATKINTKPR